MKASYTLLGALIYEFVVVTNGFVRPLMFRYATKVEPAQHLRLILIQAMTDQPSALCKLKNLWTKTNQSVGDFFVFPDVDEGDEKVLPESEATQTSKERPLIAKERPETIIIEHSDFLMTKLRDKEVTTHSVLKRLCRNGNERKCLRCSFYAESDAQLIWHIDQRKHHYGQKLLRNERDQFVFRLQRRLASKGLITLPSVVKTVTWTNVLYLADRMTDAELKTLLELHVISNRLIKLNLEDDVEDDTEDDEVEYEDE